MAPSAHDPAVGRTHEHGSANSVPTRQHGTVGLSVSGRWIAASALAVAALGGCSSTSPSSSESVTDLKGTVTVTERRPEPRTLAGGNADGDGTTTFGMASNRVPEAEEMEVLGVRVNASAGVEIVDVLVVPGPGDWSAGSWDGGGPGLPPAGEMLGEAELKIGSVLAPEVFETSTDSDPFLQVLLILSVPSDGEVRAINGIDVAYRLGDELKEEQFRLALLSCTQSPSCVDALNDDPSDVLDRLGLLAVD